MPTRQVIPPPGHGTPGPWRGLGPLLSVVCLILLVVGGFVLAAAQPRVPNLMDKRWEGRVQTTWNLDQAAIARNCITLALVVAVAGLVIHRALGARRGDNSTRALAALGAIATVGALYCWFSIPFA